MVHTVLPSYVLGSRREPRERNVLSVIGQSQLVDLKVETGTAKSCQLEHSVPGA